MSDAVRKAGAIPKGIDFSEKMIAIAKTMFPDISFAKGDAQNLRFEDASFDRVLINFGLLHVSHPDKACAEACRVMKRAQWNGIFQLRLIFSKLNAMRAFARPGC